MTTQKHTSGHIPTHSHLSRNVLPALQLAQWNTAYEQGWRATSGQGNPYNKGTIKYDAWKAGFKAGRKNRCAKAIVRRRR